MGERKSAYELIRQEWERSVFRRQNRERSFTAFWNKTLHDGFVEVEAQGVKVKFLRNNALRGVLPNHQPVAEGAFSLVLHPSLTMSDGRHAHNPWLQELADPVTKIVWDNYVAISETTAASLGIGEGDVVTIQTEEKDRLELPAHLQPGQHDRALSIALGYGRKGTDRFTDVGPKWIQAKPTSRRVSLSV